MPEADRVTHRAGVHCQTRSRDYECSRIFQNESFFTILPPRNVLRQLACGTQHLGTLGCYAAIRVSTGRPAALHSG